MDKELIFKEINLRKYKYTEITKDIRLYYKEEGDLNKFSSICIECTGWVCDGKNEYAFSKESSIQILFSSIAYWDGIRHLYFGDERSDNYGYLYYQSLPKFIKALQELRALEEKFCREPGD